MGPRLASPLETILPATTKTMPRYAERIVIKGALHDGAFCEISRLLTFSNVFLSTSSRKFRRDGGNGLLLVLLLNGRR